MKIPRKIHQTWKSSILPESTNLLANSWKEYHPDWEYYLWTDDDNLKFVHDFFPELTSIFEGFETNIQRADAIRYLILFKLGGLYVDVDFECFTSFEPYLKEETCVFAVEPEEHALANESLQKDVRDSPKKTFMICNAFMACEPEHPFMKLIINELFNSTLIKIPDINVKVMETTGPNMVTRVYEKYNSKENVTIWKSDTVYPLSRFQVLCMLNGLPLESNQQQKLDNSLGMHYWFNSWVVGAYKPYRL